MEIKSLNGALIGGAKNEQGVSAKQDENPAALFGNVLLEGGPGGSGLLGSVVSELKKLDFQA